MEPHAKAYPYPAKHISGISKRGVFLFLLLLAVFLFITLQASYAQATPTIEWQYAYGDEYQNGFNNVCQTADGGYIAVGRKGVVTPFLNYNYWVVKVNAAGIVAWNRNYGGSRGDVATTVLQTADGGYLVGGTTTSYNADVTGSHGQADVWILKLDAAGNITWKKCYGGSGDDSCSKIVQLPGGNYLVAGSTNSTDGDLAGFTNPTGNDDAWIFELTTSGSIVWQKTYGGSGRDRIYDIVLTPAGHITAAGATQSSDGDVALNYGMDDMWVLQVDASGNLLWEKSLGGHHDDEARGLVATADGGYIVSGVTSSNDGLVTGYHGGVSDTWVVKLDGGGNMIWQKTLGGSLGESGQAVARQGNAYVVASASASSDEDVTHPLGNVDVWLSAVDNLGNVLWKENYGGSLADGAVMYDGYGMGIISTVDGDLLVATSTNSNEIIHGVSSNHGYLLKLIPPPCDTSVVIHDTAVCANNAGILLLPADTGASYTWNTGAVTPAMHTDTAGTFWRVTTDGCNLHTDTFIIRDTTMYLSVTHDTMVCYNTATILAASDDFTTYLWNDGQTTQSISTTDQGTFWRIASGGCHIVTDTFTVKRKKALRKPDLGPDRDVCSGTPAEIGDPQDSVQYLWNTGVTDSILLPSETGLYVLTVSNGCESLRDTIQVTVYNCNECLFLPGAFTPNGDGLNDNFGAIANCPVSTFTMEIFDRWGALIFAADNITGRWNGTFNGAAMPVGTYYYHILWSGPGGKTGNSKGDITLIR